MTEQTENLTVGACTLDQASWKWSVIENPYSINHTNIDRTKELAETKAKVQLLEKDLASSRSSYKYADEARNKYQKEITELHSLLDTFKNSMGDSGESIFDRSSLAIRLVSVLTKEFVWKGDKE